jgi:hypothetical protein
LANSEVKHQDICTQAAHSILTLAQYNNDLFILRRVSSLVPYFICVSGLFNFAMEDDGVQVGLLHLRHSDSDPVMTEAYLQEGELAGVKPAAL